MWYVKRSSKIRTLIYKFWIQFSDICYLIYDTCSHLGSWDMHSISGIDHISSAYLWVLNEQQTRWNALCNRHRAGRRSYDVTCLVQLLNFFHPWTARMLAAAYEECRRHDHWRSLASGPWRSCQHGLAIFSPCVCFPENCRAVRVTDINVLASANFMSTRLL